MHGGSVIFSQILQMAQNLINFIVILLILYRNFIEFYTFETKIFWFYLFVSTLS